MGILYQQFTKNLLPRQVRRAAKMLRVKTKVSIDESAVQRCRSWSMTGNGMCRLLPHRWVILNRDQPRIKE